MSCSLSTLSLLTQCKGAPLSKLKLNREASYNNITTLFEYQDYKAVQYAQFYALVSVS